MDAATQLGVFIYFFTSSYELALYMDDDYYTG